MVQIGTAMVRGQEHCHHLPDWVHRLAGGKGYHKETKTTTDDEECSYHRSVAPQFEPLRSTDLVHIKPHIQAGRCWSCKLTSDLHTCTCILKDYAEGCSYTQGPPMQGDQGMDEHHHHEGGQGQHQAIGHSHTRQHRKHNWPFKTRPA